MSLQKSSYNETGIGTTTAVGIFPKGMSECGTLDLSGNVWEWCLNEYDNPERVQLEGHEWRVLRGGTWEWDDYYAASPFRLSFNPDGRISLFCFRVVVLGWRPNAKALNSDSGL
jgi:formylglycine-generating enzyme required for sulfatase activity